MIIVISGTVNDEISNDLISEISAVAEKFNLSIVKQYSVSNTLIASIMPAEDEFNTPPAEISNDAELEVTSDIAPEPVVIQEPIAPEEDIESVIDSEDDIEELPAPISQCAIINIDANVCIPYRYENLNTVLKVPSVSVSDNFVVFNFFGNIIRYMSAQSSNSMDNPIWHIENPSHTILPNTILVGIKFEEDNNTRGVLIDVVCSDNNETEIIFGNDYQPTQN